MKTWPTASWSAVTPWTLACWSEARSSFGNGRLADRRRGGGGRWQRHVHHRFPLLVSLKPSRSGWSKYSSRSGLLGSNSQSHTSSPAPWPTAPRGGKICAAQAWSAR